MAMDIVARGMAASKAPLDDNGKIPSQYLPSYVDDIIDLVGVVPTAPEHCSTGDKYYNTTTKLIYTATATDTWGTEGETPERGKIYLDTSVTPSASYRYDGTGLVQVGQDLSNYVKFTDHAASNETGVIKVNADLGTTTDTDGTLKSTTITRADYADADNSTFLSKGTAENVYEKNIATGSYSTSLEGNASTTIASTNVGHNSSAFGWGASAFGADAQVGTDSSRVPGAIQLGRGTNTEAGTMYVGLSLNGSTWNNYKLLNNEGKVPRASVESGFITMEEYDSTTTPAENVLYYVTEN